jgi:hypothetical protein
MQISNILNGWQNFLSKSEVSESLAKQRAQICLNCPYNKEGKVLAFIKDDLKEIESHYCDLCKCPLSAKLRSENEKCDLGLW